MEQSPSPPPRSRKWEQAPGNIEDLEEYTCACHYTFRPREYQHSPQYVVEDLEEYIANLNSYRLYDPRPPKPPTSIAIRLINGVWDFNATACNAAIKKAKKNHHDTHMRALRFLAGHRRAKTCKRAQRRDIALLPSRKPAVTERNQNESPLLRLPLELRIQIYDYIHDSPGIITISERFRRKRYRLVGQVRPVSHHTDQCMRIRQTCSCCISNTVLALPITCRQLYAETIHYQYNSSPFCFNDTRLILALPRTIPVKHLRTISLLCLRFDLEPLTTALHVPSALEDEVDHSRAVVKPRKEYVEFWHFIARTLRSLQVLDVALNLLPIPGEAAMERRIVESLLQPMFQSEESGTKSGWSSGLRLFDVRLGSLGAAPINSARSLSRECQEKHAPFFLGNSCGCTIDCRMCGECKDSEEYCLRRKKGPAVRRGRRL